MILRFCLASSQASFRALGRRWRGCLDVARAPRALPASRGPSRGAYSGRSRVASRVERMFQSDCRQLVRSGRRRICGRRHIAGVHNQKFTNDRQAISTQCRDSLSSLSSLALDGSAPYSASQHRLRQRGAHFDGHSWSGGKWPRNTRIGTGCVPMLPRYRHQGKISAEIRGAALERCHSARLSTLRYSVVTLFRAFDGCDDRGRDPGLRSIAYSMRLRRPGSPERSYAREQFAVSWRFPDFAIPGFPRSQIWRFSVTIASVC